MTLNIFIASSSELTDYRVAIGDFIRKLSDEKEPFGLRIKMICWEDYNPEYHGVRKQNEYNEDLVKDCDIFVVLFKEICGKYTQEEVRYAQKVIKESNIHCITIGGDCKEKAEICKFINDSHLTTTTCLTNSDIESELRKYIEEYLINEQINLPIPAATNQSNRVYATLPNDAYPLISESALGNMIRSFDYLCEKYFDKRCYLDMHSINKLLNDNYYIGILNNTLSKEDEQELNAAIKAPGTQCVLQNVVVYKSKSGKVFDNHPFLKSLIDAKGLFYKDCDINVIKYNLLLWVINQTIIAINSNSLTSSIRFVNGYIYFRDYCIISKSNWYGKSNREILRAIEKDVNAAVFSSYDYITNDINDSIDFAKVKLDTEDLLQNRQDKIENIHQIDSKLKQNISALNARISAFFKKSCLKNEEVVELAKTLETLIKLETTVLDNGPDANLCTPWSLLQVQVRYVSLLEEYSNVLNRDINTWYKRVVDTADQHHIITPAVEVMRMNYANYEARSGLHNQASELYAKCETHLELIANPSVLVIAQMMQLYMNMINHHLDLGNYDTANLLINKVSRHINEWQPKLSETELNVYRCLLVSCRIKQPNQHNLQTIYNEAKELYLSINKIDPQNVPIDFIDDIYLYLPNMISVLCIDHLDNKNWTKGKALSYLDSMKDNLTRCANYLDKLVLAQYRGLMFHNYARLYDCLKDKQKALFYIEKAIKVRREFESVMQNITAKNILSESLLLAGAIYINAAGNKKILTRDAEMVSKYAHECLNLYKQCNTQDHLESITCVYKSILLLGTLEFHKLNGNIVLGAQLINECKSWSDSNPNNSYKEIFDGCYYRYCNHP